MSKTRELFARHKLRCTSQRCALYEALVDKHHPSAEELYRHVKPTISHLSRATVYNTLDALCNAGLARRLPTNNGCCRYDADTSEHAHVCFRGDGFIQDVPPDLGARLIDQIPRSVLTKIEDRLGVEVDGINVQLLVRRRHAASC